MPTHICYIHIVLKLILESLDSNQKKNHKCDFCKSDSSHIRMRSDMTSQSDFFRSVSGCSNRIWKCLRHHSNCDTQQRQIQRDGSPSEQPSRIHAATSKAWTTTQTTLNSLWTDTNTLSTGTLEGRSNIIGYHRLRTPSATHAAKLMSGQTNPIWSVASNSLDSLS